MRTEEAVRRFREAAIAKAHFETARRDHALHRTMVKYWRFLSAQGPEGRNAFRALLADESPEVRLWVAAQLLSEGDSDAAMVVIAEIEAGGLLGFEAEVVLKEWRAGRLGSPFGATSG
jgi:hypothetical protein